MSQKISHEKLNRSLKKRDGGAGHRWDGRARYTPPGAVTYEDAAFEIVIQKSGSKMIDEIKRRRKIARKARRMKAKAALAKCPAWQQELHARK